MAHLEQGALKAVIVPAHVTDLLESVLQNVRMGGLG